jgi:plastocyanin
MLILLSLSVVAQPMFFTFFDGNIYTASKIFRPQIFNSMSPSSNSIIKEVGFIKINITETGFIPSSVLVDKGQKVIWQNQRSKLPALIMGVREISGVRSGFIQPGETFVWEPSQQGKFTYVDGVVIGLEGKIVVG